MRNDATCREPGLTGGKGQSSRSTRRKKRKLQTICTCAEFSTRRWHSGRTTVMRFETGEANLLLLKSSWSASTSELWASSVVGWQTCVSICSHVRRYREQQACQQGDLSCKKWAVEKWKKVLFVAFVLSRLYLIFLFTPPLFYFSCK